MVRPRIVYFKGIPKDPQFSQILESINKVSKGVEQVHIPKNIHNQYRHFGYIVCKTVGDREVFYQTKNIRTKRYKLSFVKFKEEIVKNYEELSRKKAIVSGIFRGENMKIQSSGSKSEASGSREPISEKLRLEEFQKRKNQFYALMNNKLENDDILGTQLSQKEEDSSFRVARINPIERRGLTRNSSV